MPQVLVIIPTHSNDETFNNAINSVLNQTHENLDITIIGDGASKSLVRQAEQFDNSDPRITFINHAKTIRRGEEIRHQVIQNSSAEFITYLADDDLFLPHHIEFLLGEISGFDFIHPIPTFINRHDEIWGMSTDVSLKESRKWHIREDRNQNSISLTGVMHTRQAYERLPEGWVPTPEGIWTDLYMWQKFLRDESFKHKTATRSTMLKFLDTQNLYDEIKINQNHSWFARMQDPNFVSLWDAQVREVHQLLAAQHFTSLEDARISIAQRDHEIATLTSQLRQLEQNFTALVQSKSWKLTSRLRRLSSLIRHLISN